jgi:hypothetical protein
MMRGAIRPGGDDSGAPAGAAGDAREAGGVEGVGQGHGGQRKLLAALTTLRSRVARPPCGCSSRLMIQLCRGALLSPQVFGLRLSPQVAQVEYYNGVADGGYRRLPV